MMYRPVFCLFCIIGIAAGEITLTATTEFDQPPALTTTVTIILSVTATAGEPIVIIGIAENDVSLADKCKFAVSSNLELIIDADATPLNYIANGKSCPITGDRTTGLYSFPVLILDINSNELAVFRVTTQPPFDQTVTTVYNSTARVTNAFTEVTVPPTTYGTKLEVVDAVSFDALSSSTIGKYVKLQFTFTANPYIEGLTVAGATLHSCFMDDDITFTSSRRFEIVGSNSCVRKEGLFTGLPSNVGFEKDQSRSTEVGGLKTFISVSPGFAAGGFSQENQTGPNYVYFKCSFTYCYNDTDTSAGSCGGPNCQPGARRRRDASDTDESVTASLELLPEEQPETEKAEQPEEPEEPCTCPDTSLMYGSLGGLGILATTCFVLMLATFVDVKRSIRVMSLSSGSTKTSTTPPCPVASTRTVSTPAGSVKSFRS